MSVFKILSPPGEVGKACVGIAFKLHHEGLVLVREREEEVILCRVNRKMQYQSCKIIYPNKISWLRVYEIEWWTETSRVDWGRGRML